MSNNNIVLLLKASRDGQSDPYVECLQQAGFQSSCISPLSFQFVNVNKLQEALRLVDQYSCLVLTSQRSVDAIRNAFSATFAADWNDILHDAWHLKPIFVVGPSTSAAELRSLAEKEKVSLQAKVLFPCGQLSLETVPKRLEEAGIETESLTIYETVADDNLADNVRSFTSQWGTPRYIVFFSPSIVNFSKHVLLESGCLQPNTKLIAIGPTTAAEMMQSLARVDGTAARPDPQQVCHVIECLSSSH